MFSEAPAILSVTELIAHWAYAVATKLSGCMHPFSTSGHSYILEACRRGVMAAVMKERTALYSHKF